MLQENKPSVGLQNPPRLLKGFFRFWNGAQAPDDNDRVDTAGLHRQDFLGRLAEEFKVERGPGRAFAGYLQKLR